MTFFDLDAEADRFYNTELPVYGLVSWLIRSTIQMFLSVGLARMFLSIHSNVYFFT